MKAIKEQDQKDLFATLKDKRESLKGFRFGLAGSKTKNLKEGRGIRKEIARILTELRARKV